MPIINLETDLEVNKNIFLVPYVPGPREIIFKGTNTLKSILMQYLKMKSHQN